MTPTPKLQEMCRPCWNEIVTHQPIARMWRRDYTLWKPDPTEITNRLGWLELPNSMRAPLVELTRFAKETQQRGIRHVVVLGMGGSSLCTEVLRQALGARPGYPELIVLDSTVPAAVAAVRDRIALDKTLFLVGSKSGTTVEITSFYQYFRDLANKALGDKAGQHFVAITDPNTPLLSTAQKESFLRTFINPSDVGGRYSALSYFGLVPAALTGIEASEFLARGREMARLCGITNPCEENPGAWLGLAMGCLARNGRDKLTLITSPALAAFGLWAEQLVAESTGKEGRGVLPIAGEPLGVAECYGPDRLFAYLRLADDDNTATDRFAAAIEASGQPVMKCDLRDRYDLGAEFFRWEFAAALSGVCLGINPFDQPNVQESKAIATQALAQCERQKALPRVEAEGSFAGLLKAAKPGDFTAFMVFAEETPELNRAFDELRRKLLMAHNLPTTLGYGPRFLHSTGQYHKGGPNHGLFVQVWAEPEDDLPVPGKPYTFGVLAAAQALGDYQALKTRGRRVMRLCAKKASDLPKLVAGLAR